MPRLGYITSSFSPTPRSSPWFDRILLLPRTGSFSALVLLPWGVKKRTVFTAAAFGGFFPHPSLSLALALALSPLLAGSQLSIVQSFFLLSAHFPGFVLLARRGVGTVQLPCTSLSRLLLIPFACEPCPSGPGCDLVAEPDQVFPSPNVPLRFPQGALLFLHAEDSVDFVGQGDDPSVASVHRVRVQNPTDHLGGPLFRPLSFSRPHDFSHDLAIRFGHQGAGASREPGAGGAADAVQIDGMRLGRLIIEHGRDGADVETAGGEVRGEKVGGVGGPEGFDRGDALLVEEEMLVLGEKGRKFKTRGQTCSWVISPWSSVTFKPQRPKIIRTRWASRFWRKKTMTLSV